MEVRNIFLVKRYDIAEAEKLPLIKKYWLGREGLHFLQAITADEQEILQKQHSDITNTR